MIPAVYGQAWKESVVDWKALQQAVSETVKSWIHDATHYDALQLKIDVVSDITSKTMKFL